MAEPMLPAALYDAAGVRALDRAAIDGLGLSAHTLMLRAAAAVLRRLETEWSAIRHITIVCGIGNNAGDGYALASLAQRAGYVVNVVQVGSTDGLGEAARSFLDTLLAAGLHLGDDFSAIDSAELIVDALFGIGLGRPVAGDFAAAISRINRSTVPVVSVDMPSGISADTGSRMGTAVHATLTVTFIALKLGLFTGDGPDYTGAIEFDDLELADLNTTNAVPTATVFTENDVAGILQPRARTAHKGDNGHVLICGGSPGYVGAVQLAGAAAARAGAGLVSIATHPALAQVANSSRPELMVHAVETAAQLGALIERVDVVAIGPGLGQSDWAMGLFATALSAKRPLVVDADALNLLAQEPSVRNDWILTPHPGEAARLLATSTSEIQTDRLTAANALQQKYGGVVVLKGAGSIVHDGKLPVVLRAGNPGMGSGGMGDVLTGLIAALVAQGFALDDAARIGACVHANAADRAAFDGERGLLASDLLPYIRALLN